jgi:hypothetical protein
LLEPFVDTDSIRPGACVLLSHFRPGGRSRPKPVTVEQIYRQEQATQPPQGIAWSPDGTRLSYIADNGDLVAVEGGTGTTQVLVDHDKMKALNPPVTSEHDLNNRTRYKQPVTAGCPTRNTCSSIPMGSCGSSIWQPRPACR